MPRGQFQPTDSLFAVKETFGPNTVGTDNFMLRAHYVHVIDAIARRYLDAFLSSQMFGRDQNFMAAKNKFGQRSAQQHTVLLRDLQNFRVTNCPNLKSNRRELVFAMRARFTNPSQRLRAIVTRCHQIASLEHFDTYGPFGREDQGTAHETRWAQSVDRHECGLGDGRGRIDNAIKQDGSVIWRKERSAICRKCDACYLRPINSHRITNIYVRNGEAVYGFTDFDPTIVISIDKRD